MSVAEYQCWLYDAFGVRVAIITTDQIVKLSYVRSVNQYGVLTLVTAREAINDQHIAADARLEVWRKPVGGAWGREGDSPWLIQTDTKGLSQTGRYRRIVAYTALHLLSRRIVAYAPGTAGGTKLGLADDVMKAFVSEAVGAGAGTVTWTGGSAARSWAGSVGVQPNAAAAGSIEKDGSRRNLLTVLQEIASDSAKDDNVGLFFDVVYGASATTLEFRTYITARGANRTTGANKLIVSPDRGSLGGTVEVTTDWSQMASFAYAGGTGEGANRLIGTWGDTSRIGASTWGLREVWVDASNVGKVPSGHPDSTTGGGYSVLPLHGEAGAEIDRRRPQRKLTGTLMSVPGAEYGVDWFFGDLLVAEFEREAFSALVDRVTITVESGRQGAEAGQRPSTTVTPGTGTSIDQINVRPPVPYGPWPEPLPGPEQPPPVHVIDGQLIGRSID